MKQVKCDVVVVGGGPAGAATALLLARRGFQVVIVDRARFPRDKVCGDYLTPGAVAILRDDIGVQPQFYAAGASVIQHEEVLTHRGARISGRATALICPRATTDDILLNAARMAGAQVVEGFAVRRVTVVESRVMGVAGLDADGVSTRIDARVTVGADGTHSLVARAMEVVQPIPRLHRIAISAYFDQPDGFPPSGAMPGDTITMALPQDGSDACCGVGVAAGNPPRVNTTLVVPIAEAPLVARSPREYLSERLVRSFPRVAERLSGASLGQVRTVGCFGHHTERASASGALLVGDAATFIHPFTGEGIYFALRGAEFASDTIARALRRGDTHRLALARYDQARSRELLPRYRLSDLIQRIVHSPRLLGWFAHRLGRSSALTDQVLSALGDVARPVDLLSLTTLRQFVLTL